MLEKLLESVVSPSVVETVRKCSLTKYNQTRYFEATVEHVCQNDHTKKKPCLFDEWEHQAEFCPRIIEVQLSLHSVVVYY